MPVVSIVGARPQYIKLAPLHSELKKLKVRHSVINTGQHYDHSLAGQFFADLQLPKPAVNLEVGSAEAGVMTAKILAGCTQALSSLKPKLVVVYGDTNSTLGGALAAAQLRIPMVHVEAGLRCHDMSVPEELNRVLTDTLSDYLMAPTDQSVENLRREGARGRIWKTGDLLYDVLKASLPTRKRQLEIIREFGFEPEKYLLITIHRADSVDNRESLTRLVSMLEKIKEPAIFPLHPRTEKRLRQFRLSGRLRKIKNLLLSEPLGYRQILSLTANARLVATDSGGLQREAYFLRKPCLLLRGVTEWLEIVRSRGSAIVGFDERRFTNGLYQRTFNFSNRSICRTGAARRIAEKIAGIYTSL